MLNECQRGKHDMFFRMVLREKQMLKESSDTYEFERPA